MLENKWQHGPARFEIPDLGPMLRGFDGLLPVYLELDADVGREVVLILQDHTSFIDTLKATRPFRLFVKSGLARNEFGPIGFLLFWIQNPAKLNAYVAAYDMYLNPTDEAQIQLWSDLATQTHWHLLLLGATGQQEDFFEFENCYDLDEFLMAVYEGCEAIEMVDFYQATEKFGKEHSIQDIFLMA